MPITKSAKKANRQGEKRRVQNLKPKRRMKSLTKKVRSLVAEKKKDEAIKLLPQAYKALDKAAKIGIIKKNASSRTKSRLAKLLK